MTLPAFMCLASGQKLFYEPLDVSAVTIDDVAYSLSRVPRYLGHNSGPAYSVAEHSVRVAYWLMDRGEPAWVCLQGLLHDATEMAVSDVPAPFKALDCMAGYRTFELRLQRALFRHFTLPEDLHPAVHEADRALLRKEVASFMPAKHDPTMWGPFLPTAEDHASPFTPFGEAAARQWFLHTFWMLRDADDDE